MFVCLYFTRETANGKAFMRKQELMDAADASGLSHVPIAYDSNHVPISNLLIFVPNHCCMFYSSFLVDRPEKGKGKVGLGNSKREWYSGWSCMKTLIEKGLVVKSSNPAK